MAEKETKNKPKDLVEVTPEEIEKLEKDPEIAKELEIIAPQKRERFSRDRFEKKDISAWIPKTELGRRVKLGKEKDLDKILKFGKRILEPEIVDSLLSLDTDLLLIGQAKGKFGGGKRRAWRQTQKKTKEGNVLTFSSMAIVGDRN